MAALFAAAVPVEPALEPVAEPKVPYPVVVAEPADPVPELPDWVAVEVEVLTRVGFWAPQG